MGVGGERRRATGRTGGGGLGRWPTVGRCEGRHLPPCDTAQGREWAVESAEGGGCEGAASRPLPGGGGAWCTRRGGMRGGGGRR